jgi:hypothetical protein
MNIYMKGLLIAISGLAASSSAIAQVHSTRTENTISYLKIVTSPSSAGAMRTTFATCQVTFQSTEDKVDCATIGNPEGYTRAEIETAERKLQRQINRSVAIRATGTIIGMVVGGTLANAALRSIPHYSGSLNVVQEAARAVAIGMGGGIGGSVGFGVGVLVADSLGNVEVQSASRDALASSQAEGRALVIVDQADGRLNDVVHAITTVLMSIEAK